MAHASLCSVFLLLYFAIFTHLKILNVTGSVCLLLSVILDSDTYLLKDRLSLYFLSSKACCG